MNVAREGFRLGGIESETEALVNGGEKRFGRPLMLEE